MSDKLILFNNLLPACIGICIDTRKYSLIERAIEAFSKGDAYHVFMVIDHKELVEAHMKKGVRRRSIADYQNGQEIVMLANPIFLPDDARRVVVDKALQWVGKKYDTRNIIGKILRRPLDDANKVICSELVALAFENVYRFKGLRPKNVTPSDILQDVKHRNGWQLEYLIHT